MIIEDNKIEKICNFYVSDFHLEMILLPYISKKIKEKEPIIIISEKDLEKSLKELISKVNLDEETKTKILELNWNSKTPKEIENNSNIILIGSKNFIENKKKKLYKSNLKNLKIIDCYNLEEVESNIKEIVLTHDKNLNTLGVTNF